MRLTRRRLMHASGTALALGGATCFAIPNVRAQTPEAQPTSANDALLDIAKAIPLSSISTNAEEGRELLTFADFAWRLESVGADLTSLSDDAAVDIWVDATLPLPPGDLLMASFRTDDALGLFGWQTLDIERCGSVMSSSNTLTVLQGRFQPDTLDAAWRAQGYEMLDINGVPVASLSAEAEVDLASEIGLLALSKANNVALIDDTLLIYASTLAGLSAMIDAYNGATESLGAYPLLQTTLGSLPDRLSGAIVLPPGAFVAANLPFEMGENSVEITEPPEPGPIPLLGVVGFVSGDSIPATDLTSTSDEPVPSGALAVSSRHFLTAAEAELAARRSLLTLETQHSSLSQQPFTEIFAGWHIDIDRAEDNVVTQIELYANEGIWAQMIYARDALFLYG